MSCRSRFHLRLVAVPAGLVLAAAATAATPPQAEAPAERPPAEEVSPEAPHVRHGDLINVFSGDVHVPAGTIQRGNVTCIGGHAVIEGEVRGDVVVVLGELDLSGRVDGSVVGVLTDQRHQDARMNELVNVLGSLQLVRTTVEREVINVLAGFDSDELSTRPTFNMNFGLWLPGLVGLLLAWRLVRLCLAFLLVLLICALAPERVRAIAEEAPARYLPALLVGLLVHLGLLVVLPILAATVVGLPFAILGYQVVKWLGIAGLFCALGSRIGRSFGREMSLLGAVLLCFGAYVVLVLGPTAFGWSGLLLSAALWVAFVLAVQAPAMGLVVLTRLGSRSGGRPVFTGPNPGPAMPAPPAPAPSGPPLSPAA